jgi:hypothetical protein
MYRVNYITNTLEDPNVDLEELARELGVLREWEMMIEEPATAA